MCGICGVIKKTNSDQETAAVRRMNEGQRFRGPDDEGLEILEGAVLGHRRLSFLDLSAAGHQPMADRGGRFRIIFNGEIYNFGELRAELESGGTVFKTKSDTEVIVELYAREGANAVSKLRGMFALAIWDIQTKKLFLARDRYGIKPLYYAITEDFLVFASTVKAIKDSGLVKTTPASGAKIGFAVFGSVPEPHTLYSEIRSLPAGCTAEYTDGRLAVKKFYEPLDFFLNKRETNSESEDIRNILAEAVRLHLLSDAPLGVFLSGGLDSSALAALAVQSRGAEPTDTLGVDFKEPDFSEKNIRDKVVSTIKSRHREALVRESDLICELPNIMAAMDQPTIDGVNTYFVSAAAKKAGLKAVLSGLGSDEIFMGYHYFRLAGRLRLMQKTLPGFVFDLLPKTGKWGRLRWFRNKHPFFAYVAARSVFAPAEAAKLVGVSEFEVWNFVGELASQLPISINRLQPADLFSYLDLTFYMRNQLLRDTDFMAMRHSVEVRVPFLDHKLVEYVSGLPAELKMAGKWPKNLLIEAMQGILPKDVWERKKMGFTFPFAVWLTNKDYFPGLTDSARRRFLAGGSWSGYWAEIIANKFGLTGQPD